MTVKLPVKKCYYVIKVVVLLGLVVSVLSLLEVWRGGSKNSAALEDDENSLEQQVLADEARIMPGLGEGGEAALLVGEEHKKGELSEKKYAMNVYLSDRISYNRTLKDYRNPACTRVMYDAELPSVSVVIVFHNEPYSALLRTVWSVLNSVRRELPVYQRARVRKGTKLGYRGQDPNAKYLYLKEIILVDDNSTLPELRDRLAHYVRTRMPPRLVRILRLPDRGGLTRARLVGAEHATGDVLVFLDAHCEMDTDWLRPLLAAVSARPHAVVVPIIDAIDSSTFYYSTQDPATFQVGGFTFAGHFTWIEVPEREKKRRGSNISPTWSPTMAGGLFAISRDYFWQLGAYDEQMAGWGGENLELSFRIWQCGGTLETVPCSRVGHVFRSFHPYGLPAASDTHGINTARMAEVWMDDYKELFYLHRPDLRNSPKIGDVTHRRVLREKLQCKSFSWYLAHVYREKFVPVRDVVAFGRFRQPDTGLCLDSLQSEADAAPLGLYPCHDALQASQYYSLSARGELRDEERCAEVEFAREADQRPLQRRVVMLACHGKRRSQRWRMLPSGRVQHVESRLCLSASPDARDAGGPASATSCDAPLNSLRWEIDYTEENNFALDKDHPTEQEVKLRSLRGQKRVPRSLSHSHHHHRRHRAPRRPRFVLHVSRPGQAARLRLEATAPHRTLHRNDSLMQDIVTALTRHHLQVENNNRLFVGDRVIELRPPAPAAARPDKRIVIEDFVELPDARGPTHKFDSSEEDGDRRPRADDSRPPPDSTPAPLVGVPRSKSQRPPRPHPGVSVMLKTNLSLHLGDRFFWSRDREPSSRENMSLLRTMPVPLPTLPPSDTDNDVDPDVNAARETNSVTDSEPGKTDKHTDYTTDGDDRPSDKTDADSDRQTDSKSEKETNTITDTDTDIKSENEADYKTESETDVKSERETKDTNITDAKSDKTDGESDTQPGSEANTITDSEVDIKSNADDAKAKRKDEVDTNASSSKEARDENGPGDYSDYSDEHS